jgi:hypothetical protein
MFIGGAIGSNERAVTYLQGRAVDIDLDQPAVASIAKGHFRLPCVSDSGTILLAFQQRKLKG